MKKVFNIVVNDNVQDIEFDDNAPLSKPLGDLFNMKAGTKVQIGDRTITFTNSMFYGHRSTAVLRAIIERVSKEEGLDERNEKHLNVCLKDEDGVLKNLAPSYFKDLVEYTVKGTATLSDYLSKKKGAVAASQEAVKKIVSIASEQSGKRNANSWKLVKELSTNLAALRLENGNATKGDMKLLGI